MLIKDGDVSLCQMSAIKDEVKMNSRLVFAYLVQE